MMIVWIACKTVGESEQRKSLMSEKVVMAVSKKDWLQGDKCLNLCKRHSMCCSHGRRCIIAEIVEGKEDQRMSACVRE